MKYFRCYTRPQSLDDSTGQSVPQQTFVTHPSPRTLLLGQISWMSISHSGQNKYNFQSVTVTWSHTFNALITFVRGSLYLALLIWHAGEMTHRSCPHLLKCFTFTSVLIEQLSSASWGANDAQHMQLDFSPVKNPACLFLSLVPYVFFFFFYVRRSFRPSTQAAFCLVKFPVQRWHHGGQRAVEAASLNHTRFWLLAPGC